MASSLVVRRSVLKRQPPHIGDPDMSHLYIGDDLSLHFVDDTGRVITPNALPAVVVGNRSPPKRSAKASASSGLAKQNTTESLTSRRRE
jgi:hypothetical protein